MQRQLVQAGGSLAVTLPAEIVKEFKLKKGMAVDVSIHPQTRAVTIRLGAKEFEGGKVTKDFKRMAASLFAKREAVYRELAK